MKTPAMIKRSAGAWREATRPFDISLEDQPQPQAPPQQPPPPPRAAGGALDEGPLARPPTATVDSSLTVSSWPCGQAAGAPDWLIGRVTRKVSPQARQRNS
jgi:hypothetical protein